MSQTEKWKFQKLFNSLKDSNVTLKDFADSQTKIWILQARLSVQSEILTAKQVLIVSDGKFIKFVMFLDETKGGRGIEEGGSFIWFENIPVSAFQMLEERTKDWHYSRKLRKLS